MHEVWEKTNINKEKWTEKGKKKIEELYDVLKRVYTVANKDDMDAINKGVNENLFIVMDILDSLRKQNNTNM